MIAIIDYGAGNLKSVQKAFSYLGFESEITSDPEKILSASHVILPGVGSFGEAMNKLNAAGLPPVIHKAIDAGVPFLGICLGLQLLFEESEESPGAKGLGVFRGRVVKIPPKAGFKIPHMGWNSIKINDACPLFSGLSGEPYVYFVHSYYPDAEDDGVVCARTEYTDTLKVGAWRKNVFAVQFHPEKSSDVGLMMLKNFAGLKKGEL
ncbi:MAG: imidazole glycerol phosphate synthase subunit HisH [Clostridia bacterium]|nr:imidazole glycerol phosphate synthase subunit HisH [Clostridia bacterium]